MIHYFPRKGLKIYLSFIFFGISFLLFVKNPCSAQSQALSSAYPALIQQADQALAAKDLAAALLYYEKATHARPELSYASGKIAEINTTLETDPNKRAVLFENIIIKAEGLYKQRNYPDAKTEYRKAILIDPALQFPKDRLSQIRAVYTDPEDVAYFNDALTNGDKALAANDFDKAVSLYETALTVKPDDKAIKDKIAKTRKQKADYKIQSETSAKNIAAGDKLLKADNRTDARSAYQKALDVTPDNQYAKQKIQEIDNYLDNQKALQDAYDKVIEVADQLYISRDFTNARLKYQEALKAKPEARYPKDMIEKTKTGESQLQSDQQKYDAALAGAENLLKSADYEAALIGFKTASGIKPAENYPKTKIAEIEKLINERNTRKEAFDLVNKNGDQSLLEKKYDIALNHYRNALSLLPGEVYPAKKIEEINKIAEQAKTLDENYRKSVAEADQQFSLKKYEDAISSYTRALVIKTGDTYALSRINEAQSQLAQLKSVDENYRAAISSGDKLLSESKYDEALTAYKQALGFKPAEKYPQDKADEISETLLKQNSDNEAYTQAVTNGNKAMTSENYNQAIALFQDAQKMKPGEVYPRQRIDEIKALIAAEQKRQEQYSTAINTGDHLFTGREYNLALVAYTEAATLKKNENYPQEQIAKINKILGDLRSAEENYKQAVTEGDQNFRNLKYTEAVASFQKASGIKPAEAYPKTQLEKINSLLAKQQKLDNDFLTLLASADQLFDTKKYVESIQDYRKALVLKPTEKYPSEKIREAEKQISELKALQAVYDKAIAEGDKQLASKDLENSLVSFKTANSAKPEESYPLKKIAEIQAILDKNKADKDRYREAVALADKFFKAEKYRDALEPYQRATTIIPSEKYPLEQIALINTKLAEQKRIDDDYQKQVSDADIQFKSGKYDAALNLYTRAGILKPQEQLPRDKVAEIGGLLADMKLKDENFRKAINTAAELYAAKNLPGAIKSYEEALRIKPEEKNPQERINTIRAEIKNIEDNYSRAVTLGDSKLASKDFMEALNAYQHALEIKPDEEYPKSKIARINSALEAQQEELAKMYNSYISDGDRLFASKDYTGAISAFTKAAGIKSAEAYPKQRIAEINKIIDEIELVRKAEYSKALGEADNLYNSKIFDLAIDAYETASGINPMDSYPVGQISKIRKYMADHAIQDLDSQTQLIKAGEEKRFNFQAIEPKMRKNNYILLKARSAGTAVTKVYLNYGKDNQKNGGIVLRSLDKTTINDYLIRISVQDKWYREDNNWISLFVETGDIEISKVQIAAGDE